MSSLRRSMAREREKGSKLELRGRPGNRGRERAWQAWSQQGNSSDYCWLYHLQPGLEEHRMLGDIYLNRKI